MYCVESRLYYQDNKENITNIGNFKEVLDIDIANGDEIKLKEFINRLRLVASTLIKNIPSPLDIKICICGSVKERIVYCLLTQLETPIKLLLRELLENGKYKYTLSMNALFYVNESKIVTAILRDYTELHINPSNKVYLCINMFQDTLFSNPYCHVYAMFKCDNPLPPIRKKIEECPYKYVLIEISMFDRGIFFLADKKNWEKGMDFKEEDLILY